MHLLGLLEKRAEIVQAPFVGAVEKIHHYFNAVISFHLTAREIPKSQVLVAWASSLEMQFIFIISSPASSTVPVIIVILLPASLFIEQVMVARSKLENDASCILI